MPILRQYRSDLVRQWVSNLGTEVDFWRGWFASMGGAWPTDFATRTTTGYPMPSWLMEHSAGRPLDDLDVGSGPISLLFGLEESVPGSRLTSADPLAHAYNMLIRNGGYESPRVDFAVAEHAATFVAGPFDVVFSQNALDHAFDPVRSVFNLLQVLKEDGLMVLIHMENEGEFENYSGLHHWNFTERGGDLIFWNRDYEVNMSLELVDVATVQVRAETAENASRRTITASVRMIPGWRSPRDPEWPESARYYVEESIRALTELHLDRLPQSS